MMWFDVGPDGKSTRRANLMERIGPGGLGYSPIGGDGHIPPRIEGAAVSGTGKSWVPSIGMWEERLRDGRWKYSIWKDGATIKATYRKRKVPRNARMTGPHVTTRD